MEKMSKDDQDKKSTWDFVLEILIKFCKEHPWLVLFNTLFLFLEPLNAVILPKFYGQTVELLKGGARSQGLIQKSFILLFSTLIVLNIGITVGDWHDTWVNYEMMSHVRKEMFNRIVDKIKGDKELNAGVLVSRFGKIPTVFLRFFERLQGTFIPSFLIMFGSSVYVMMSSDKVLGTVMLTITMIMLILVVKTNDHCKPHTLSLEKCLIDIYDNIDDTLRNSISIAERRQHAFEEERLYKKETYYKEYQSNVQTCNMKLKTAIFLISLAVYLVFIKRTIDFNKNGTLQVAMFVTTFSIVTHFVARISYLSEAVKELEFAWASLDIAKKDFSSYMPQNNNNMNNNVNVSNPLKCIEARGLGFKHRYSKKYTFKNLNFDICQGEKVTIRGPIGCGKTTLMKLFMGFILPTEGSLTINGISIHNISDEWMRNNIALVPQNPSLFDRSLYENIVYGQKHPLSKEEVLKFMEDLGIQDIAKNKPEGLDFKVGKGGSKLSGGQRQLVYCMRILLNNPKIVLLDEPTSSLDMQSKQKLTKMLKNIMKDKVVIMVTHDDYLLKQATRTIDLSKHIYTTS